MDLDFDLESLLCESIHKNATQGQPLEEQEEVSPPKVEIEVVARNDLNM